MACRPQVRGQMLRQRALCFLPGRPPEDRSRLDPASASVTRPVHLIGPPLHIIRGSCYGSGLNATSIFRSGLNCIQSLLQSGPNLLPLLSAYNGMIQA